MPVRIAHALTIDQWRPTPLNRLVNSHWAVRRKLKKFDLDVIGLAARLQRVPRAAGRRRVSLRVTVKPRQRRTDPDSYWKSTLDALVKLGLLRNDSPVWCELGTVEQVRGKAESTTITLEDL